MKYTEKHCVSSDFRRGFSSVINLFGKSNNKDYKKELSRINNKYNNRINDEISQIWIDVGNTLHEVMNETKKK